MTFEADYLIVGSGAVGMAFADTLLTETDASIIIVDRYAKPGGHWNMAYPFVQVHQPSLYYGVNSVELSKGRIEASGMNVGLNELATGGEVLAYYDEVMRHHFLPTGRVRYFPMCEYMANSNTSNSKSRQFKSIVNGETHTVKIKKKFVDATHLTVNVPSIHKPNFSVAEDVWFMPLNDLPKLGTGGTEVPEGYVVIGAGKTGVDACLWLLEHNVSPDKITWIMPRDPWMLDRKHTQPTEEFFFDAMGAQADHMESIAKAASIDDMFERLGASGYLLRLDSEVRPKMFHGATVSRLELTALRQIKNIIRLGRITSIENHKIILQAGEVPTSKSIVHINCSAVGLTNIKTKPIFADEVITPQMVRSYQPVFSAAFIAHIENYCQSDKEKNALCQVVPVPNGDVEFINFTIVSMMNQFNWTQDPEIRKWLLKSRLDGFGSLLARIDKKDEAKMAVMRRMRLNAPLAMQKLYQFQAELQANT